MPKTRGSIVKFADSVAASCMLTVREVSQNYQTENQICQAGMARSAVAACYIVLLVTFPVTSKYMTLNDLDGLFSVKFCFHAGLAR